MSRGQKAPSEVFRTVLREAQQDVIAASRKAALFDQKGIRGDERAAALMHFLRDRLPEAFGVCKGEAIDCHDQRSGQSDLMVYHKHSCVPVSAQEENMLIPCEGLYCVLEVKSILSQEELIKAYSAAAKVRTLRPFDGQFIPSRSGGKSAKAGQSRCMYVVFAYSSNLGADDWLRKEYARIFQASLEMSAPMDLVDRVVVLDRGIINPVQRTGKAVEGDEDVLFVEFYLHLVNFIDRELRHRPAIDWQNYSSRSARGWISLD